MEPAPTPPAPSGREVVTLHSAPGLRVLASGQAHCWTGRESAPQEEYRRHSRWGFSMETQPQPGTRSPLIRTKVVIPRGDNLLRRPRLLLFTQGNIPRHCLPMVCTDYGNRFSLADLDGERCAILHEQLHQRFLQAPLNLGEASLQHGDLQAQRGLEQVLGMGDSRQEARRGPMRCHAGTGERAKTIAVNREWSWILEYELGTGPSKETSDVHRSLVAESRPIPARAE